MSGLSLSIIIVAHNQAAYLPQTFDSLRRQTCGIKNLEIILINDSSTDETQTLFDRFQAEHLENTRTQCVQFKNVGQTRNAGLALVSTPYLVFLDGDDLLSEDACTQLIHTAQSTEAEMIVTPLARFKDHPDNNQTERTFSISLLSPSDLLKQLLQHNRYMGHIGGTCFKTSLFQHLRFPPFTAYEDVFLMPDLIRHSNHIALLNQPIYYYRQHTGSTSSTLNDDKAGYMLEVLDKLKTAADSPELNTLHQALCIKQCRILLDNVKTLSQEHKTSIAKIINQIPLWSFLLAPHVRTSRKRILLQTRKEIRSWER